MYIDCSIHNFIHFEVTNVSLMGRIANRSWPGGVEEHITGEKWMEQVI